MPSVDWVIFVFAPTIVIFGVMLFFPEVAVQFFFLKHGALGPLNRHK